jgi:uncharacterized iron-regulated membrane protein
MTTFRSEEPLVGIVALAAVGWIVWIVRRGMRDRRLPIGKSHVDRVERPAAFRVLFAFYIAAGLLMAFVGLDLLVGITSRI